MLNTIQTIATVCHRALVTLAFKTLQQAHVSLSNESFIDLRTVHSNYWLDKPNAFLLIRELASLDTRGAIAWKIKKSVIYHSNASSLCSIMKSLHNKETSQNP